MQIDKKDLFMLAEAIDTIDDNLKRGLERQQNNIISEINNKSREIIDEVKRKNQGTSPKAVENTLFQKLHELVMTNYIKKYRGRNFQIEL